MIKTNRTLSLVALSMLVLAGCGQQQPTEEVNNEQTPPTTINQDVNTANTAANTTTAPTSTLSCEESITAYLDEAAGFNGEGHQIENNDEIVVDYIGRLEDGTVFDTSVESVAVSCGKHNPYRNYEEGLGFTVNAGQMIAGFDAAVKGMQINQTKTVTIPAAEAYGEYDEAKTQEVDLADLPTKEGGYQAGDELGSPMGKVVIKEVTDTVAVIDLNHELAGKDLIFDITIKEIK